MRELGPGAHSSARGQHACQPSSTGTPVILMPVTINCKELFRIRGSIVVSISACHAEDPGSIPGGGVFQLFGVAGRRSSPNQVLRGAAGPSGLMTQMAPQSLSPHYQIAVHEYQLRYSLAG